MFITLQCFLGAPSFGEESGLCRDLASFACAPGAYSDGTGTVKSELELSKFVGKYAETSRDFLQQEFRNQINRPGNSDFKRQAMNALGLAHAPICESTDAIQQKGCSENIVEGLTLIAQKHVLGAIVPQSGLDRIGNVKGLSAILKSSVYKEIVIKFNQRAQKDLDNPPLREKIRNNVVPEIKALIIARLDKIEMNAATRESMSNRIKAIELDETSCASSVPKTPDGDDEVISGQLSSNAHYNPLTNKFTVCSGYLLQSTSMFHLARSIAHELSHGIDPCRIDTTTSFKYSEDSPEIVDKEYPIQGLVECLRDEKSLGAILGGPDNRCEFDQIGEAFADWMAGEVVPTYIEQNFNLTPEQYRYGYANAHRPQCTLGANSDEGNEHPPYEKRINNLFLASPKIRGQMGCGQQTRARYCTTMEATKPLLSPKAPEVVR